MFVRKIAQFRLGTRKSILLKQNVFSRRFSSPLKDQRVLRLFSTSSSNVESRTTTTNVGVQSNPVSDIGTLQQRSDASVVRKLPTTMEELRNQYDSLAENPVARKLLKLLKSHATDYKHIKVPFSHISAAIKSALVITDKSHKINVSGCIQSLAQLGYDFTSKECNELYLDLCKIYFEDKSTKIIPFVQLLNGLSEAGVSWRSQNIPKELKQAVINELHPMFTMNKTSKHRCFDPIIHQLAAMNVPWSEIPTETQNLMFQTYKNQSSLIVELNKGRVLSDLGIMGVDYKAQTQENQQHIMNELASFSIGCEKLDPTERKTSTIMLFSRVMRRLSNNLNITSEDIPKQVQESLQNVYQLLKPIDSALLDSSLSSVEQNRILFNIASPPTVAVTKKNTKPTTAKTVSTLDLPNILSEAATAKGDRPRTLSRESVPKITTSSKMAMTKAPEKSLSDTSVAASQSATINRTADATLTGLDMIMPPSPVATHSLSSANSSGANGANLGGGGRNVKVIRKVITVTEYIEEICSETGVVTRSEIVRPSTTTVIETNLESATANAVTETNLDASFVSNKPYAAAKVVMGAGFQSSAGQLSPASTNTIVRPVTQALSVEDALASQLKAQQQQTAVKQTDSSDSLSEPFVANHRTVDNRNKTTPERSKTGTHSQSNHSFMENNQRLVELVSQKANTTTVEATRKKYGVPKIATPVALMMVTAGPTVSTATTASAAASAGVAAAAASVATTKKAKGKDSFEKLLWKGLFSQLPWDKTTEFDRVKLTEYIKANSVELFASDNILKTILILGRYKQVPFSLVKSELIAEEVAKALEKQPSSVTFLIQHFGLLQNSTWEALDRDMKQVLESAIVRNSSKLTVRNIIVLVKALSKLQAQFNVLHFETIQALVTVIRNKVSEFSLWDIGHLTKYLPELHNQLTPIKFEHEHGTEKSASIYAIHEAIVARLKQEELVTFYEKNPVFMAPIIDYFAFLQSLPQECNLAAKYSLNMSAFQAPVAVPNSAAEAPVNANVNSAVGTTVEDSSTSSLSVAVESTSVDMQRTVEPVTVCESESSTVFTTGLEAAVVADVTVGESLASSSTENHMSLLRIDTACVGGVHLQPSNVELHTPSTSELSASAAMTTASPSIMSFRERLLRSKQQTQQQTADVPFVTESHVALRSSGSVGEAEASASSTLEASVALESNFANTFQSFTGAAEPAHTTTAAVPVAAPMFTETKAVEATTAAADDDDVPLIPQWTDVPDVIFPQKRNARRTTPSHGKKRKSSENAMWFTDKRHSDRLSAAVAPSVADGLKLRSDTLNESILKAFQSVAGTVEAVEPVGSENMESVGILRDMLSPNTASQTSTVTAPATQKPVLSFTDESPLIPSPITAPDVIFQPQTTGFHDDNNKSKLWQKVKVKPQKAALWADMSTTEQEHLVTKYKYLFKNSVVDSLDLVVELGKLHAPLSPFFNEVAAVVMTKLKPEQIGSISSKMKIITAFYEMGTKWADLPLFLTNRLEHSVMQIAPYLSSEHLHGRFNWLIHCLDGMEAPYSLAPENGIMFRQKEALVPSAKAHTIEPNVVVDTTAVTSIVAPSMENVKVPSATEPLSVEAEYAVGTAARTVPTPTPNIEVMMPTAVTSTRASINTQSQLPVADDAPLIPSVANAPDVMFDLQKHNGAVNMPLKSKIKTKTKKSSENIKNTSTAETTPNKPVTTEAALWSQMSESEQNHVVEKYKSLFKNSVFKPLDLITELGKLNVPLQYFHWQVYAEILNKMRPNKVGSIENKMKLITVLKQMGATWSELPPHITTAIENSVMQITPYLADKRLAGLLRDLKHMNAPVSMTKSGIVFDATYSVLSEPVTVVPRATAASEQAHTSTTTTHSSSEQQQQQSQLSQQQQGQTVVESQNEQHLEFQQQLQVAFENTQKNLPSQPQQNQINSPQTAPLHVVDGSPLIPVHIDAPDVLFTAKSSVIGTANYSDKSKCSADKRWRGKLRRKQPVEEGMESWYDMTKQEKNEFVTEYKRTFEGKDNLIYFNGNSGYDAIAKLGKKEIPFSIFQHEITECIAKRPYRVFRSRNRTDSVFWSLLKMGARWSDFPPNVTNEFETAIELFASEYDLGGTIRIVHAMHGMGVCFGELRQSTVDALEYALNCHKNELSREVLAKADEMRTAASSHSYQQHQAQAQAQAQANSVAECAEESSGTVAAVAMIDKKWADFNEDEQEILFSALTDKNSDYFDHKSRKETFSMLGALEIPYLVLAEQCNACFQTRGDLELFSSPENASDFASVLEAFGQMKASFMGLEPEIKRVFEILLSRHTRHFSSDDVCRVFSALTAMEARFGDMEPSTVMALATAVKLNATKFTEQQLTSMLQTLPALHSTPPPFAAVAKDAAWSIHDTLLCMYARAEASREAFVKQVQQQLCNTDNVEARVEVEGEVQVGISSVTPASCTDRTEVKDYIQFIQGTARGRELYRQYLGRELVLNSSANKSNNSDSSNSNGDALNSKAIGSINVVPMVQAKHYVDVYEIPEEYSEYEEGNEEFQEGDLLHTVTTAVSSGVNTASAEIVETDLTTIHNSNSRSSSSGHGGDKRFSGTFIQPFPTVYPPSFQSIAQSVGSTVGDILRSTATATGGTTDCQQNLTFEERIKAATAETLRKQAQRSRFNSLPHSELRRSASLAVEEKYNSQPIVAPLMPSGVKSWKNLSVGERDEIATKINENKDQYFSLGKLTKLLRWFAELQMPVKEYKTEITSCFVNKIDIDYLADHMVHFTNIISLLGKLDDLQWKDLSTEAKAGIEQIIIRKARKYTALQLTDILCGLNGLGVSFVDLQPATMQAIVTSVKINTTVFTEKEIERLMMVTPSLHRQLLLSTPLRETVTIDTALQESYEMTVAKPVPINRPVFRVQDAAWSVHEVLLTCYKTNNIKKNANNIASRLGGNSDISSCSGTEEMSLFAEKYIRFLQSAPEGRDLLRAIMGDNFVTFRANVMDAPVRKRAVSTEKRKNFSTSSEMSVAQMALCFGL